VTILFSGTDISIKVHLARCGEIISEAVCRSLLIGAVNHKFTNSQNTGFFVLWHIDLLLRRASVNSSRC
jgi:hypothetical protein